ncbi:MAG: hypothetical protein ACP5LF_06300 [Nitrososphaeria archaeon]|nr:hypothetical protein [Conexivisphaerales archaeon]
MEKLLLVTYLPFNRIHEIKKYFDLSVKAAQPDEVMIFIDNVVDGFQKELLKEKIGYKIMTGNWGSRVLTWISILEEFEKFEGRMLVVDSDNVLDTGINEIARSWKETFLTFMDWEDYVNGSRGIMPRSKKIGELEFGTQKRPLYRFSVYNGSLFGSGATFFIGPKQSVLMTRKLDKDLLNRLKKSVEQLPKSLLKHISDETLLAVIAYLMGLKEVCWTVGTKHYHSKPESMDNVQLKLMKSVNALAHERLADALYKEFRIKEFRTYRRKYMLARLKNALYSIF